MAARMENINPVAGELGSFSSMVASMENINPVAGNLQ